MGIFYEPSPNLSSVIQLNYLTPVTVAEESAFELAKTKWNSIITEELEEILIDGEVTTKIIIDVSIIAIDGPSGVLGQAAPTGLRSGSLRTATGIMEFDSADMTALANSGLLDEVILHEMGHVLQIGVGPLWTNLLVGSGTNDPGFNGTQAVAEYSTLTGSAEADVPVENVGGAGSIESHWRDSLFNNEIMTSFLNSGINPLSRLTIAALDDMGYVVDYSKAEFYSLNAPLQGGAALREGDGLASWTCPGCSEDFDPATLEIYPCI